MGWGAVGVAADVCADAVADDRLLLLLGARYKSFQLSLERVTVKTYNPPGAEVSICFWYLFGVYIFCECFLHIYIFFCGGVCLIFCVCLVCVLYDLLCFIFVSNCI